MKTREAAHLLVALSSAEDKRPLLVSAIQRRSLSKIEDAAVGQVSKILATANEDALEHLNLVLANNPKKSISEILRRPDVVEALTEPYEKAAKQAEDVLLGAWKRAEEDAVQKTKSEFKLWGTEWQGYSMDTKVRDALVQDLHANAKAMRSRYRQALVSRESEGRSRRLSQVSKDAQRRAELSVGVAVWTAGSQVKDSAYSNAKTNRIWLSRMDNRTCSNCRRMHGKVVGPGESFPLPKGVKLYKALKSLKGPPMHPLCRCVVAMTHLPKN